MSDASNLKRVAKGGALYTVGTISAHILKLVIGIVIVRYITVSEYGLISFGYVLANIAVVLASLGLRNSLPRMIARRRQERGGGESIGEISGTSILIIGICSVLASFVFYFWAGAIAQQLDKPELEYALRGFAFMIVPLALLHALTAVFQGWQQAKPKVIFEDGIVHVARILLIVIAIILSMEFEGVLYAYVASVWIGFISISAYAILKNGQASMFRVKVALIPGILAFSLPLLGVGLVNQMTGWVGTVILGIYQSADEIALYMAPSRLQMLLVVPLAALSFIYIPVATRLHAQKDYKALKSLYSSGTKWVAIFTLPLAFFFIANAEYVVTLLFGEKYQQSAVVLQIMAVGYSMHCLMGPNMATLISCGYPKYVLYGSAVAAIASIAVSMSLVPRFGAQGAAVATGLALILSNIFSSYILIKKTGVHPFRSEYAWMIITLMLAAGIIYFIVAAVKVEAHYVHMALLAAIYMVAMLFPFISRNIDAEDLEILGAIENKFIGSTGYTARLGEWLKEK